MTEASDSPDPRDPFALLAQSRALAAQQQWSPALEAARRALSQYPPYQFFPRAEKFLRQLRPHAEPGLRACRVAVLGSSTVSLLVPVLQALCLRDRIDATFYQGLYNATEQEILDPQSGLNAFQPQVVFLISHWRSLNVPAGLPDPTVFVDERAQQQQQLWQQLTDRFRCHVVQHAFDYPAAESFGPLANSLPNGRARLIEALNRRLTELAPSHVSLLDTPLLQREVGASWEDSAHWYRFQQHPSTEALPALAELQAAHLRAALGLSKKVLVTDLDNTLWHGVIGEDNLDGIGVGPGSAEGEAHADLQRYLLELKSRGILLGVCSKNNLADAESPFAQHTGMALTLADFASFKANWQDKATNLREMSEELSLGLDSFVFLDDSPMEREWVREQLPQVTVIDLDPSPLNYLRALHRGRHFFALNLSKEDLSRAESYRVEAAREQIKRSAGSGADSIDKFLSELQLRATAEPVTPKNRERVTQLINKTNQFNLTTRRYTDAQVALVAENPANYAAAFSLADRLGSYGLIGVLMALERREEAGTLQWEVDTWLMSCRVLGRQMEKFMFDRLLDSARSHHVSEIIAVYRPTPKNVLVKDLCSQLGFHQLSHSAEETRYRFTVPALSAPLATHVQMST